MKLKTSFYKRFDSCPRGNCISFARSQHRFESERTPIEVNATEVDGVVAAATIASATAAAATAIAECFEFVYS